MRLRPFFKYFGAKHRLAPKYPPPRHSVICEPFAGSAQYATLYAERSVILADTDPDVAALWSYLIRAEPSEIRQLPVNLPVGLDLRDLDVPLGAQLLVRHWQRVGVGRCWTVSKWSGANTGFWCAETRDTIAAQLPAIRHWRVFCEDMTRHAWTLPATWFVDPPYQSQPTVYGDAPPDFAALAAWVKALPGQAIVCEAPGADWLPFEPLAENTVGRTRQGSTRPKRQELVWVSADA